MMIGPTFTNAAANTLTLYAERIGVCLDRLTPEQIWARASTEENAIGNLVLHLAGNLRQYTRHAILGEPDIRTRDDEFNAESGDDLKQRLATVVADAASIIRAVTDERLTARIIVQNREMTVLEAIFKTTEHFALHTGQIMSATKRATSAPLGFTTHNRKPEA